MKKLTTFDTKDRIKKDFYEYHNIKFSTSLPLFNLILYMVECGMSADELITDLQAKINTVVNMNTLLLEYMALMYPFFAIKEDRSIRYIAYGSGKYSITENIRDGVITGIEVSHATSWDNSIVNAGSIDIKETIKWCLDSFSSSINMAAL